MPPDPIALVLLRIVTGLPTHLLSDSLLENMLMLITYILILLKRKSNNRIGANSNCRKDFLWLQKIDPFTLSKNLV